MAQTIPASDAEILDREAGLHRHLTPRQLSMIAIGGAIGTGLFLGSAISVKLAGPGVIFSYFAAAGLALCLMWALKCTCIRWRVLRCAIPIGWDRSSPRAARSSLHRSTANIGFRTCRRGCGSPGFRQRSF